MTLAISFSVSYSVVHVLLWLVITIIYRSLWNYCTRSVLYTQVSDTGTWYRYLRDTECATADLLIHSPIHSPIHSVSYTASLHTLTVQCTPWSYIDFKYFCVCAQRRKRSASFISLSLVFHPKTPFSLTKLFNWYHYYFLSFNFNKLPLPNFFFFRSYSCFLSSFLAFTAFFF